ncbi:MAG: hypothetical protein WA610_13120 [Thermodesulfovibrionales bacterium]
MKYSALIFSFLLLLLVTGCRETPSEDRVRDVMARYLAERHLAIRSLEIGEIRGESMNTQVYMGSPSYMVVIRTVTLEATQDTMALTGLRKGQSVTYKNARVKVREKNRQKDTWEISVISGMPLL